MSEEVKSVSEQKKEDWMNSKWRPMMGWMYMLVCTMDFVGFPVLWSLLQMISHGNVSSQWQPLTLQGAGLFHIAMGAVIGISAYGRTQEKLGGAAGSAVSFPQGAGTTYVPSTGNTSVIVSNQPTSGGFGNGTTTPTAGSPGGFTAPGAPQAGFGAPASGFGSPAPATTGFGSPTPSMAATTGGFGSSSGFGAPATPTAATGVTTGFGGKKAPAPQDDPVL